MEVGMLIQDARQDPRDVDPAPPVTAIKTCQCSLSSTASSAAVAYYTTGLVIADSDFGHARDGFRRSMPVCRQFELLPCLTPESTCNGEITQTPGQAGRQVTRMAATRHPALVVRLRIFAWLVV